MEAARKIPLHLLRDRVSCSRVTSIKDRLLGISTTNPKRQMQPVTQEIFIPARKVAVGKRESGESLKESDGLFSTVLGDSPGPLFTCEGNGHPGCAAPGFYIS